MEIRMGDYVGSMFGCELSAIEALMPTTYPFSGFLCIYFS
jgi:hypothetical protein